MTKPDSTDAGGVTHEEARRVLRLIRGWHYSTAKLWNYIDQQEAALATLTRERDELRRWLVAQYEHGDKVNVHTVLSFLPATTPAPLPGGQGPVTVAMLHQLFYDAPSDTFENFVCYIVNTLADRLERGGEGREG